jgi:anti-anti-sigma factor
MVHDLQIRHHHAQQDNSVVIVEMTGEIDVQTSPAMKRYLLKLIDRAIIKLVIDFRDVEFLDSSGLGVLVYVLKRVRRAGGAFVLTGLSRNLLGMFQLVGFTKVMWICHDTNAAIALFEDMATVRRSPCRRDAAASDRTWLTSKIYLASDDNHEAAEAALADVIKAFGLQVNMAFRPVRASWFREFILKARKHGKTAPPVEDQLAKLVRTIEMQALHRPQAEIDAAQGDAVAKLIIALDQTPRAVVQVGSVLLVKVDCNVVVRNLTQLELAHWERNPALFRNPEAALNELQRAATQSEHPGPPPAISA